jgi:hypothetical protein
MTQSIQYPIIGPSWMFVDTNGAPIEVKSVSGALLASTANQSLIAAVTGKRLRVLSIIVNSAGATTVISLKNGSGGAIIMSFNVPASTNGENAVFDIDPIGWCDTAAGVALVADLGGAICGYSIRYIEYTQAT